MNATVMAIILVLIVVATVVTKKVPFNFVLFIVPIICSLLLGFSLQETSDFVLEQFSSIMKSAGFMLLFAFLYFQMLTEAGVFDTIISAVTNKLGDKMNVIVIMILTSVIAALSANELSKASVPWALCFIPAIVLQWVYFGIKHKKRVGTFGVVVENVEEETKEVEENPYRRPKLFWINFILFIVFMVGLGVFSLPPYLVFMAATVVTAMINYPKNFGEIFGKVGPMYLNIIVMLLAISVYQAVFNNTGMVGAVSDGLIKICPKFMLEYIHIILLLLCVIIIYFIPFQIFNAMYPVFISIGAGFGIPAVTIIAPFVCNLSLATSSTPTNSSTYLGCALTETDVQHFCKKAVPVQTVTNAIVILLALIFGIV